MTHYRDKKLLQRIAISLKQLREVRGLTQVEVFDDTGIHIGRLETAKVNVTVSTLALLCEYYKMSFSEFMRKVEVMDLPVRDKRKR
jgi:transcriptional regulator with XRE-family HTH domain